MKPSKKLGPEVMKQVRDSVAAAFSMYSRFPVPYVEFTPDRLRGVLAAFPLVGTAIGLLLMLLLLILRYIPMSSVLGGFLLLLALILPTGAIHLDGFADASDAIFSSRGKEEELRIMKDPHAGPMAVIALILLLFGEGAALADIYTDVLFGQSALRHGVILLLILTFSRSLSGFLSLHLPKARKDGQLRMMTDPANAKILRMLVVESAVTAALLLVIGSWQGLMTALAMFFTALLAKQFFMKRYEGITGDLAGFFLCLAEWVGLTAWALLV